MKFVYFIIGLFSEESVCLFHYKPVSERIFFFTSGLLTLKFVRRGNWARISEKQVLCFKVSSSYVQDLPSHKFPVSNSN
jgi:hypothetical protein